MGFVFRRGTRDKPKYYARYVDIDGGEKTRRIKAARTKERRVCTSQHRPE